MRAEDRTVIVSFTRRQHGLVAVWQLKAGGIPLEAVEWARRHGALCTYRHGVLMTPGTPPHTAQGILAACLAAGPDAVASHWAAGGLHLLRGVAAGAIEISVAHDRRREGVIVHRLIQPLDSCDRSRCLGVPVTTVARTLVDLAGSGHIWLVERALDDAMVRGLCSLREVAAAADRAGPRRGRAGIQRLLAARQDDQVDSHQELRWLRAIRGGAGVEPEMHHRVATPEGVFEIDIAFPAFKVGFEVNGWEVHGRTRSAFDHDARKGLALLAQGWHIGTLTSNMNEQVVVRSVKAMLTRYGQSIGGFPVS